MESIHEAMEREKSIEIGEFTVCPCIDYPDGTKSVWIEEASGEGGQFPQESLAKVIRKFYNSNF